jgi:hypothetical protein
MRLVMFSGVESRRYTWIMKALVVAEFVELTPARYRLSIRAGEWSTEIGQSARGL